MLRTKFLCETTFLSLKEPTKVRRLGFCYCRFLLLHHPLLRFICASSIRAVEWITIQLFHGPITDLAAGTCRRRQLRALRIHSHHKSITPNCQRRFHHSPIHASGHDRARCRVIFALVADMPPSCRHGLAHNRQLLPLLFDRDSHAFKSRFLVRYLHVLEASFLVAFLQPQVAWTDARIGWDRKFASCRKTPCPYGLLGGNFVTISLNIVDHSLRGLRLPKGTGSVSWPCCSP